MITKPIKDSSEFIDASSSPIIKMGAPVSTAPYTVVKPTGAPVPFSPKAQNNMTGVFGNPIEGSYDRSMGNAFNPPIPTIAPIVPVDNLYNT